MLFGRLLRALGITVTSGRLIEFAGCLASIDIGRRDDFKTAARCVLVSRHEDYAAFDFAFAVFWRSWKEGRSNDPLARLIEDVSRQTPSTEKAPAGVRGKPQTESSRAQRSGVKPGKPGADAPDQDEERESIIALYSPGEVLRARDFAQLDEEELADAKRFLTQVQWSLTHRRSLRTRPQRSGRGLDVRRSIRRNLRHGGELLDLALRGPKLKRRQLVLLCDISGSMDRYTRLLLHFLHSVESSNQKVEVFVFGTRLTRVTRALRKRDPDDAIAAAAAQVQDWSGGTRIGESIRAFNRQWARRVLGHGAIVIVISDGWDRGDPEILAVEMARLQRASYRLLWLNPLLGSSNYRPLTQGIQAAMPWIDDFLPAHNLASLEALARLLNNVQEGRPNRRHVRLPTVTL